MPWRAVVNVFKDKEDFFLLQKYKKCSQEMQERAAVNVLKNIKVFFSTKIQKNALRRYNEGQQRTSSKIQNTRSEIQKILEIEKHKRYKKWCTQEMQWRTAADVRPAAKKRSLTHHCSSHPSKIFFFLSFLLVLFSFFLTHHSFSHSRKIWRSSETQWYSPSCRMPEYPTPMIKPTQGTLPSSKAGFLVSFLVDARGGAMTGHRCHIWLL